MGRRKTCRNRPSFRDVEDNRWYFAYWNDEYKLRDLEKTLHSKELLENLFSEMYVERYLPEFYNKCLNA